MLAARRLPPAARRPPPAACWRLSKHALLRFAKHWLQLRQGERSVFAAIARLLQHSLLHLRVAHCDFYLRLTLPWHRPTTYDELPLGIGAAARAALRDSIRTEPGRGGLR